MFNGDLEFVKSKIEYIRFAMVKVTGKPFLKQDRFLGEALNTDYDGNLWIRLKDELPIQLKSSKGFHVTLQFIHKEEDMFLKAKGKAVLEQHPENFAELNGPDEQNQLKGPVLKIEMHSAQYFKKKTLSRYTSKLQNICNLTLKKVLPGIKA
ncbi:MAG: hypothetical protein ACXWV5_01375 [Flavitalea sp.]